MNARLWPLCLRKGPISYCTGGWVGSRAGLEECEKSRLYRGSKPEPVSLAFIPYKSYYRPRWLNKHIKEEKDTNGCVAYCVHVGVM